MSDEECSECPCNNVLEENSMVICQDCGNVVHENPDYRWDPKCIDQKDFNKKLMLKKSSDYIAPPKRVTESVQHGLMLINRLSNLLNLPQNIAKAASQTYKAIIEGDAFKHRQTQTKQCMAIWCLYLISRKNGSILSLSQVAGSCDIVCDIGHLSETYSRLRKNFPDLSSCVDILDLVPICLENFSYESKEKCQIINTTRDLADLFQKAALVQGYNPVFVIHSLAFFAWKILDSCRLNIKFRQYCKILQIDYHSTTRQNIVFYTKMLIELYKCSPEYFEQSNLNKVILVKIPDILRTKNIIVFNFNKSHPEHITKKRQRSRSNQKSQPEIFDEDFSDTEIEQYLKSKDEIKAALQVRNSCL